MDSYFQAMPYDIQKVIYNKVYADHLEELNNEIKKLKKENDDSKQHIVHLGNQIAYLDNQIDILQLMQQRDYYRLRKT